MQNFKTKIITTITAICMMLAVFVMGVFALKTVTYNVGGTVNFTAGGVAVTVSSATLNGCAHVSNSDTSTKMLGFTTTVGQTSNPSQISSWTGLNLRFSSDTTKTATIKFTIKNNSSSEGVTVNANTKSDGTLKNATITFSCDKTTIPAEQTANCTITFTVKDTDYDASITGFSWTITLGRA